MIKLKRLFTLFKNGILCHIVNFILCVLAFFTFIYFVCTDFDHEDVFLRIFMSFAFSYLFTLAVTIIIRRFRRKSVLAVNIISAVISFAACLLTLNGFTQDGSISDYANMGYAGLMLAMLFLCIYFSSIQALAHSYGKHFVHLVKYGIFSFIITSVVQAGLFICAAAVVFLLFDIKDSHKIFIIISFFDYAVLFPALFTATLPLKDDDYKESKPSKILSLYIITPIYILLMLILYIYLIKILVTLTFPSGQINWFASFATLAGFVLWFFMQEFKSAYPLVKLFTKWLGALLLPVIIVQIIAVWIRLSAYGLTTPRYLSLLCIIIAVIGCAALLMKNGRYFPKILLLTAGFAVIAALGPLNAIDIPIKSQQIRLENVLLRNHMLLDHTVIPKDDLADEDKRIISDSYDYLRYAEKNSLDFIGVSDRSHDFAEIFGFEPSPYRIDRNQIRYSYHYGSNAAKEPLIDVSGYKTLYALYYGEDFDSGVLSADTFDYNIYISQGLPADSPYYTVSLLEPKNGKYYKFSLKNIVPNLHEDYFSDDANVISADGQAKLLINILSFSIENGNILYASMDAKLLLK